MYENINEIYEKAPTVEPDRQRYFMDVARELVKEQSEKLGRPLFSNVTTFGCQMNLALEM